MKFGAEMLLDSLSTYHNVNFNHKMLNILHGDLHAFFFASRVKLPKCISKQKYFENSLQNVNFMLNGFSVLVYSFPINSYWMEC